MDNWLTEDLKQEVRKVFEPQYKRELNDEEIMMIANNLVGLIETYAKYKWKKEYGKRV